MSTWIVNGGASIVANSSVDRAPNGTNTAALVSRTAGQSYIERQNEATCFSGTDYIFHTFVKVQSNDAADDIIMRVGDDLTNSYAETIFDVSANFVRLGPSIVGDNIANTLAHIENVGSGWYSIQMGFRFNTRSLLQIGLTSITTPGSGVAEKTLTDTDSVASSFLFWSPTIEERSLVEDPAYLGTGYEGSVPAVDRIFSHIPVYRGTTNSIEYTDRFGDDVSIGVVNQGNAFNTANSVSYIRIPQDATHGFPSEVTINDNRGVARILKLDRQDRYEKREPVRITFENKQGVFDDFWAIRRSTESLNVNNDTYYNNVINYNTLSYSEHEHSMTKYNVVGRQSIKVNTAFIPETENSFMEELFMSENVWLTERGETYPVLLENKDFEYKTHVNDGLVQYELIFNRSNRVDNTIR